VPDRSSPGLAALLEGIELPPDLVPFTSGLRPNELDLRLVLTTTAPTIDIRDRMTAALEAIDMTVQWDGLVGTARRFDGLVTCQLHPPIDPTTVRVPQSRSKRKQKFQPDPLRPDFAGAAFAATIVELRVAGPGHGEDA
jgi:hypothetical protein